MSDAGCHLWRTQATDRWLKGLYSDRSQPSSALKGGPRPLLLLTQRILTCDCKGVISILIKRMANEAGMRVLFAWRWDKRGGTRWWSYTTYLPFIISISFLLLHMYSFICQSNVLESQCKSWRIAGLRFAVHPLAPRDKKSFASGPCEKPLGGRKTVTPFDKLQKYMCVSTH